MKTCSFLHGHITETMKVYKAYGENTYLLKGIFIHTNKIVSVHFNMFIMVCFLTKLRDLC